MTGWFWVYDDPGRRLSLIRGDVRDLLAAAGVSERARWSTKARGYVLTMEDATDVMAMADHQDRPYRVKRVEG